MQLPGLAMVEVLRWCSDSLSNIQEPETCAPSPQVARFQGEEVQAMAGILPLQNELAVVRAAEGEARSEVKSLRQILGRGARGKRSQLFLVRRTENRFMSAVQFRLLTFRSHLSLDNLRVKKRHLHSR